MQASTVNIIWIIVQLLIGYNLVLPLLLNIVYLLLKRKTGIPPEPPGYAEADYAIIVTAYEQTHTLPAVVESLLRLKYSNYLVYIVADKCDVSELKFNDEKVVVLRPEETLSSNTRSHFYAIHRFKRNHERLTIIDSDNLVDAGYLVELNKYFDKGFKAVQGTRSAKNLDTMYSRLDAVRDIYYHFYDGEVLFSIGSSATLAGSGMAFTVELYRECLSHLDISGAGFDKVLQKEILSRKYRIAFAGKAIVYDEKTSRSDQLVKQRARWINTWFKYFSFGFALIGKGVINFNRNQFLFGLILLRPPLFIFLLLSVLCILINLFVSPLIALLWLIGLVVFMSGFFIALAHAKADKVIYRSLMGIPMFIFYQVLSLLKVGKANKFSVATQHYHDKKIEEIK